MVVYSLEHWGVFEHVRDDDEPDLAAAHEHLIEMKLLAIPASHVDIVQAHVHRVFSLHQIPSVKLSAFEFDCHYVVLSLVQKLDWHSNTHLYLCAAMLESLSEF